MAAGCWLELRRGRGAGPEICDPAPGPVREEERSRSMVPGKAVKRRLQKEEGVFDFVSYPDSYCTRMQRVHHACMENWVQDPDVHKENSICLEACSYGFSD